MTQTKKIRTAIVKTALIEFYKVQDGSGIDFEHEIYFKEMIDAVIKETAERLSMSKEKVGYVLMSEFLFKYQELYEKVAKTVKAELKTTVGIKHAVHAGYKEILNKNLPRNKETQKELINSITSKVNEDFYYNLSTSEMSENFLWLLFSSIFEEIEAKVKVKDVS